jgi:hypothetical protein
MPIDLIRDITEPNFVHQWGFTKRRCDYLFPYHTGAYIKICLPDSSLEIIPYEDALND